MENRQSIKSVAFLAVIFVVGVGLIAGCGDKESGQAEGEQPAMSEQEAMTGQQPAEALTYEATLEGSNEVPPVTTEASGSFTVTLEGDSIHVQGTFSGLSSEYVASHIHKGGENENGRAVIPLDPSVGPDKRSGTWDASYPVDESQISALKADSLYVNVHSAKHKPGEIRGQLTASGSDE